MITSSPAGHDGIGVVVKWLLSVLAVALACASALIPAAAGAEQRDPLISPASGGAGVLFQVVGETGWTPGESVTISVGFSDTDPDGQYAGAFYHERQVTVLRDGTWSFPIVVNNQLVPFPLWRPGYIVVRAQSGAHVAINSFIYTVEGRAPIGAPPLAELGFGPAAGLSAVPFTLALFIAGAGVLFIASGAIRRNGVTYSSPMSRRNASMFGSRPRKLRTNSSPSTVPPRSRILRR